MLWITHVTITLSTVVGGLLPVLLSILEIDPLRWLFSPSETLTPHSVVASLLFDFLALQEV